MSRVLLLIICFSFLLVVLAIFVKEVRVLRRWKEDQKAIDWWEEKQ